MGESWLMSFEKQSSGSSVPVSLRASTPVGDVVLQSALGQTIVDQTNVISATLIVSNPSTTKPLVGMAFFVFGEVRVEIDTVAAQFQAEGRAYVNGVLVNDQANHNYPIQKSGTTTQALIRWDQNAPIFPHPVTVPAGGSVTLLLRMDYNYISGTPRDVTYQQGYVAFYGVA